MGGGGTETSTQTNAPSNPDVQPTLSKLLQGLQGTYDSASGQPNPAALNAGWSAQMLAAGNPDYARGVGSAMADFGSVAAGNKFGLNDPGYATLRAQAGEDTLTEVGSMFTGSGRFGSGSHVDQATESLGNVYAGMDYQNYQNDIARQQQAASMLPQLFGASQAPGAVMASVGEQHRAAPWYNLGQASSILAGTAGTGGSTTTQTTPTAPWWQQVLGAGAIGSGIYKNFQ